MSWQFRESDGSLWPLEPRPTLSDLRQVSAALVASGEPVPLLVATHRPRGRFRDRMEEMDFRSARLP